MIRLIIVTVFLTLFVLLAGPPLILDAALSGKADRLYRVAVWGVSFAVRLAGIEVRVEGLENIPPGVCVFVANHTSTAEPPAVVGAIPRRVSLLAKKEIFRVPIVGAALRAAQLVPVDRSDRDAAIASVETAIQYLRGGLSFLVYPEGTRSPDGRLRPFKKGSFVMAIRAGVPVVPISAAGAQKVMRKGRLTIHPGVITVRFHPAVDAAKYSLETKEELLERVHAAIASGLPPEQQPLEIPVATKESSEP
jgi:1-acyl-sn-glycerol-3-phosphate acyltransferase